MKKHILCIVCLLFVTVGQSQTKLFPIRIDHKWGFVNDDGEQVIAPKYDAVGVFDNCNYTNMLLKGSIGLVHKNGEELFIQGANALRVFDDSTVAVRKDTLWGAFNMKGTELIPTAFTSIVPDSLGNLMVQIGDSVGLKTRDNRFLLACKYHSIESSKELYYKGTTKDSVRYISKLGETLLTGRNGQYQEENWPMVLDQNGMESGSILHVEKMRRSPIYQKCKLIKGTDYLLVLENGETVLYNALNGAQFPIPEGSSVKPYVNGFYKYFKNGKQGILNARGAVVLPASFDNITLRNGLFLVYNNQQFGLYQTSGKATLPVAYENIYRDPSGLWMIQKQRLLGCAKPNGTVILEPVFQQTQVIDRQLRGNYGDNKIAFIEFDEAWNVTDKFIYKNVKTVFLDFGRVNGPLVPRVGIADSSIQQNEKKSPPKYWFKSKANRKWGFRREDGSLRHSAKFDFIEHFNASGFTKTLERIPSDAPVKVLDGEYYQNRRCGIAFTANGNYLAPPKYWHVFKSELRVTDAAYVKVLRYDGFSQIIMRDDAKPVKKLFTYLDTLVEDMARYNVGGNLVVNEDKNYRTNLCTQREFQQRHSISPVGTDIRSLALMNTSYVRFDYGKWGFLAKDGSNVIDAVYDFVYPFYKGTAIVKYNNQWGVIDKDGNFIVKPLYWNVKRVEYNGKVFFHVFKKQARFGLIDTEGNTVLYPEFLKAGNFKQGMLAVKYKQGWTFIDSTQQLISTPQYEEVRDFRNGRAAVKKGGKWGFINRQGDVVVMPTYNKVLSYSCNRAWAFVRGKWYLLDRTGKPVSKYTFKNPSPFTNKVAFVQKANGTTDYGLLNIEGDFIVKPRFASVSPFNHFGVAVVETKGLKALLTVQGNFQTEFEYTRIDSFSCGWAVAQKNGAQVLLHYSGRTKPLQGTYQSIEQFQHGVARVSLEARYGYIDTSGREIIPCSLTRARPFSEGKAFIQRKGLGTQCINTSGEVLFSTKGWVQYDFKEGKAVVRREGKSYFVDSIGTVLFDKGFKSAKPFSEGSGRVKIGKKWAVINEYGQMLNGPKFVKIKTYNCPVAVVKRSGSYGLFSDEGKVVLDIIYDEMQLSEERYYFLSVQDKVGHYDLAGTWVWEPSR